MYHCGAHVQDTAWLQIYTLLQWMLQWVDVQFLVSLTEVTQQCA